MIYTYCLLRSLLEKRLFVRVGARGLETITRRQRAGFNGRKILHGGLWDEKNERALAYEADPSMLNENVNGQ